MLSSSLRRASRSDRIRRAVESASSTRRVVARFVAGTDSESAIRAASTVAGAGMLSTLDLLGEDVTNAVAAARTRDGYMMLLDQLHAAGLAEGSEASVKLSAVGQGLPIGGHDVASRHAREICARADAIGCRVTFDMEDHTTVDSSLAIGNELRGEFPWVGNVLQANLYRTKSDIAALAGTGARIRLVKGAYREPRSVAYQSKADVDASYLRGLQALMESDCYPMVATHDESMINAARAAAERFRRDPTQWEAQMLFGIRADLQERLAHDGKQVRIYIPYGTDWYGYFMRRLAERPANVAFFLRALAHR